LAPCKFFDVDEESEIGSGESRESEEANYEEDKELEPEDLIKIYITDRNYIREQSKSVIPVCGVLLTGVFGLLYFIFSGKNNMVLIDEYIIGLLVLAALFLASSIVASIKSVQASRLDILPWTERFYLSYIVGIYHKEHKWGRRSIYLLGIALAIFIVIIIYFSCEYIVNMSPSGSTSYSIQNIIIIPMPRLI
jgi:hypothetical protein